MKKITSILLSLVMIVSMCSITAFAKSNVDKPNGKVYVFDSKNYKINDQTKPEDTVFGAFTYGKLYVAGDISNTAGNKIPEYEVKSGNLSVKYKYSDKYLKAKETDWHLAKDSSTKINGAKCGKVKKGTILIQTSKVNKNYSEKDRINNIFYDKPSNKKAIFKTNDDELYAGTYYRVYVAYKLEKKIPTGSKIKKFDTKEKWILEVYTFKAYSKNAAVLEEPDYLDSTPIYSGRNANGYNEDKGLESDNVHYGWKLGQFQITGHTDRKKLENQDTFIKNPSDTIKLDFKLDQNIDALNGDSDLVINEEHNARNEKFNTDKYEMKRGALFIRYKDENNQLHDEINPHVNYLYDVNSAKADTSVELNEEGDYEIVLDYEIKSTKHGLPEYFHYYIYEQFSIRNGNCMIYPRDIVTGNELSSGNNTQNGFYIDFANSKYLDVYVEIESPSGNGDIRRNIPVKDHEQFTDAGLYTITVKNNATGKTVSKRITVKMDDKLATALTTGGSLKYIIKNAKAGTDILNSSVEKVSSTSPTLVIIICAAAIVIIVGVVSLLKRKK